MSQKCCQATLDAAQCREATLALAEARRRVHIVNQRDRHQHCRNGSTQSASVLHEENSN
jgi:hypothetical protein